MKASNRIRAAARWFGVGVGVAAGTYLAMAAVGWARYGHAKAASRSDEQDDLLDTFMPTYDIVERHHVRVAAPAAVTFAAAQDHDLFQSPFIRAIFRTREVVMGAKSEARPAARSLIGQMHDAGWGVLAEVPRREMVMGAITQPWEPNVTFQALPPDEFAAFHDPGYVKIVWTLRADPVNEGESIFRTETRAVATDAAARQRFRRYWAFVSPGIATIRWLLLQPMKREAERRVRS